MTKEKAGIFIINYLSAEDSQKRCFDLIHRLSSGITLPQNVEKVNNL
jgi:hypothetical protein